MSSSFYVNPEQLVNDKAQFAQKGIARGKSIIAAIYDQGVLMVGENTSASLNKISEITTALPSRELASTTNLIAFAKAAFAGPTIRDTFTRARTLMLAR